MRVKTKPLARKGRRRRRQGKSWLTLLTVVIVAVYSYYNGDYNGNPLDFSREIARDNPSTGQVIQCNRPTITDGDTFRCVGERVRLEGIDAPEMPGHCKQGRKCTPGDPYAAKRALEKLTQTNVTCRRITTDHYGRMIARCTADGIDLSCAMLKSGHAVRRYGQIWCGF